MFYSPWYPGAPMSREQEIAMLEGQAQAMERDLDFVRKRIEELKKQGATPSEPYPAQPGPYPPYGGMPMAAPWGMPYGGMPMGTMPGMPMAPEQELDSLRGQADAVKAELEQIESRIRELEKP